MQGSDYYFNSAIKNTLVVIAFIIINIVLYFLCFKDESLTFNTMRSLVALSTLAIIFLAMFLFCVKNFGFVLGTIISVVALLLLAGGLDMLLTKAGLPLSDDIYDPIFSTIGLIIFGVSLFRAISNFRNYKLLSDAEFKKMAEEQNINISQNNN